VALAAPRNGTVEVGGPEPLAFEDFIRDRLRAAGDQRSVVTDPEALYFGARLAERTLVPRDDAQLAATHYADWLASQAEPG
jgi:hypothetical protein